MAAYLAAGRRAALVTLVADPTVKHTSGTTPEVFNGTGDIIVNGMNIGLAIDAAVLETIVQCEPRLQNSRDGRKPSLWQHFWAGCAVCAAILAFMLWVFE